MIPGFQSQIPKIGNYAVLVIFWGKPQINPKLTSSLLMQAAATYVLCFLHIHWCIKKIACLHIMYVHVLYTYTHMHIYIYS